MGKELEKYLKKMTELPPGQGRCTFAAIFGDAGQKLDQVPKSASSLKSSEVRQLLSSYGDLSPLSGNGIHLQGAKFIFLRREGDIVIGRNKTHGCVALKTKKSLVVVIYPAEEISGNVVKNIVKIGDSLKENKL